MKSHHIPLVIFLSFFFFKATALQAMPPVIEEGPVPKHERMPGKETWKPDGGEFKSTDSVSSEEHEGYKGPNDSSSIDVSYHPQEPQNQNSMNNPISNNHLAPNTPTPFAPAETPSSPGTSHPSIVTTSDGRRIFQVPHQETTNRPPGNFFSELDNQHTWKRVGEATSAQEQFEEALSAMRTGRDLFSYQRKDEGDETEEPKFIKRTFDGRGMIRMIATGEISLDHFQNLSLEDYSLYELPQALAFALSDNIIQEPDKKEPDKKEPDKKEPNEEEPNEEVALRSANYRKNYNEAVERGIRILTELIENKTLKEGEGASEEEKGRLFKGYFFQTITDLHEGFTCLEESKEKSDSRSRDILLCKGMVLIKVIEEKLQPKPRANIVQGLKTVLELFERVEGIVRRYTICTSGSLSTYASDVQGQALALLGAIKEEAQLNPRRNIVDGYNDAYVLFEKAALRASRGIMLYSDIGHTRLQREALDLLEATNAAANPLLHEGP